jgi:hypothetical protein
VILNVNYYNTSITILFLLLLNHRVDFSLTSLEFLNPSFLANEPTLTDSLQCHEY